MNVLKNKIISDEDGIRETYNLFKWASRKPDRFIQQWPGWKRLGISNTNGTPACYCNNIMEDPVVIRYCLSCFLDGIFGKHCLCNLSHNIVYGHYFAASNMALNTIIANEVRKVYRRVVKK